MTAAEADPSWTKTNVSGSQRRSQGRLRARLAGLAALFGVLLGAFALPSTAQAQDAVSAWISAGHNSYIDIGGAPAVVTVTVQPNFQPGQGPKHATIKASLSGLDGYVMLDTDGGDCTRTGPDHVTCETITANEGQRNVQFALSPATESDIPEGETKQGELKLDYGGDAKGNEKTTITVAGHHQAGPKSVTQINGTVTSNAEPVADAKVVLTDGEGTTHETTTGGDGAYVFQGNDQDKYIAPGDMKLTVTKDGFEELVQEFQVIEGTSYQQNVTLAQVESEPEETTEAASEEPSSAAPSPSAAANEDDGGISGTLLTLIIIGALLVLGGIVGIVFLLRGGKDDDDDDPKESFADGPPEHQPTAAQVGSPGVYQAGPAPGAEAPTMIHNGPLVQDQEVGAYGAPAGGFGPAYGNDDSTQVMPQAGGPAAPPPPAVGPNDTQILSTVKGLDNPSSAPGVPSAPHGPGGDATQVMPQAGGPAAPPPRPPQSPYAEPNYGAPAAPSPAHTQPHPSPSPTPPPVGSSMFEPHNPDLAPGSQPPVSRDPYAPPVHQSQPNPAADPYPGQAPSRDPYAPPAQPSAPPAGPYTPQPTQAMPQGGYVSEPMYGSQPQSGPPPSPYAADQPQQPEGESPQGSHYRRDDEERKGWGEWDDRPRSW
ncbi:hypothetical protein GCM10027447_05570 [Glycomyces halotolerans]